MERLLYIVAVLVLFPMTCGQLPDNAGMDLMCSSRFDHDFKVLQKLAELEQAHTNGCSNRCPNGWTTYGTSCYGFINNVEFTWDQALEVCTSFCGGHLASFETYAEQVFAMESVKKLKNSDGANKFYWVGATDSDVEGIWVWQSSGEALSDGGARWSPGQPSGGTNQNCGNLWGGYNFTLEDHECDGQGFFICERQLGVCGQVTL